MGLDHRPHISQLRNEMLKTKRNNKGKANDVNVVNKGSKGKYNKEKPPHNIIMHKSGQEQKDAWQVDYLNTRPLMNG